MAGLYAVARAWLGICLVAVTGRKTGMWLASGYSRVVCVRLAETLLHPTPPLRLHDDADRAQKAVRHETEGGGGALRQSRRVQRGAETQHKPTEGRREQRRRRSPTSEQYLPTLLYRGLA